MKNKHLYWVIAAIWSIPLLTYLSLGIFIKGMFLVDEAAERYWVPDFYLLLALTMLANAILLLLGMLRYHPLFHYFYLITGTLVIFGLGMDVYMRISWLGRDGDAFVPSVIALAYHLFLFNATLRNLTEIRIKSGLAPLRLG